MALAILLLNPCKICLNALKDLLRFVWAILFHKPFFSVSILFGIVAPILPMTQRHNIGRYRSGTIRVCQWYPMILRYRMPQAGRSATNSAAPVKIIERPLPVLYCGISRKSLATCGPIARIERSLRFKLVAMYSIVVRRIFNTGMTVFVILMTISCAVFERVLAIPTMVVVRVFCQSLLRPISFICCNFIAVMFPIVFIVLIGPFIIVLSPLLSALTCAGSATRRYAEFLRLITVKVFKRSWEFYTALGASFEGRVCGMIKVRHGVHLTVSQSPAGRNRAGAFVSFIIPQIKAELA